MRRASAMPCMYGVTTYAVIAEPLLVEGAFPYGKARRRTRCSRLLADRRADCDLESWILRSAPGRSSLRPERSVLLVNPLILTPVTTPTVIDGRADEP